MSDELKQDNLVDNTIISELEKLYLGALNLVWQQIGPAEMKIITVQGEKADNRGN